MPLGKFLGPSKPQYSDLVGRGLHPGGHNWGQVCVVRVSTREAPAHSRSSARAEPTQASSASPPGAPILSFHPGQEQCPPHARGFPIRGWALGFPDREYPVLRVGGGRGAGRTRLCIPGILGGGCGQLPLTVAALPGALAQCQAVPARPSSIPLGVPLGFEVKGTPLVSVPLISGCHRIRQTPTLEGEIGGSWGQSVSRRGILL